MKNRNKVIIILSVIFLISAIAILITGFVLSGADVIGWFSSKWAIWLYVCLGIYVLLIAGIFISERIKNL